MWSRSNANVNISQKSLIRTETSRNKLIHDENWQMERWRRLLRSSEQWWRLELRCDPRGRRRTVVSWRLTARWRDHQWRSFRGCTGPATRRSLSDCGCSDCRWGRIRCWFRTTTSNGRSRHACRRCRCSTGWRSSWQSWVQTASWNTTNHCRRWTASCRPRRRYPPSPTDTLLPLATNRSCNCIQPKLNHCYSYYTVVLRKRDRLQGNTNRPKSGLATAKRRAQDRSAWRLLVATATSSTSSWRRKSGNTVLRLVTLEILIRSAPKSAWSTTSFHSEY